MDQDNGSRAGTPETYPHASSSDREGGIVLVSTRLPHLPRQKVAQNHRSWLRILAQVEEPEVGQDERASL